MRRINTFGVAGQAVLGEIGTELREGTLVSLDGADGQVALFEAQREGDSECG